MTAAAPVARPRARWILPPAPDQATVDVLRAELNLPEVICRLLATRGHLPAETAKRYLRPRLDQLLPLDQMLDMGRAVERLAQAVESLAEFPERGSHPKELLELGIREYRQVFFKPYRLIYRVSDEKAYVHLIADGRRDMQSLLTRRLLGS